MVSEQQPWPVQLRRTVLMLPAFVVCLVVGNLILSELVHAVQLLFALLSMELQNRQE